MNEANNEINNLSDLSKLNDTDQPITNSEPKIDSLGRSYATGRRKESTARVWVKRGTGNVTINGKKMVDYFARPVLQMQLNFVFDIAERKDQFDVIATVKGGGLSGQAGAVRHGLSRALSLFEPDLRKPLKAAGMLTRDSRVVERKKYGKAKARKSFQFSNPSPALTLSYVLLSGGTWPRTRLWMRSCIVMELPHYLSLR